MGNKIKRPLHLCQTLLKYVISLFGYQNVSSFKMSPSCGDLETRSSPHLVTVKAECGNRHFLVFSFVFFPVASNTYIQQITTMGTYCNKGTHEISQQKNDIFSVIALRMLYILEALAFSGLDILLLKEAKRHFTSTEKAVKKKKKFTFLV